VRTPVGTKIKEEAPTVSVKKIYLSHNSEAPLFNTHNQSVETTPLPPDPEGPEGPFPKLRGYEILSVVGYGGMGIVYEARHKELNRRVAIKMLRVEILAGSEFRERFRAEAEAIARLQHPNIIQVFEVGTLEQQDGVPHSHPFIALEFVDGGCLMERTGTPQTSTYSARLVETLARAAHAAHQLGIIHRDLKPANVLLTGDGVPKIADFGIAKQIDAKHSATNKQLTRDGSVVGTPEYMAPEQFAEVKATPAIDVYALGVILYELLTARVPFQGACFADTMLLTTGQEPVPPRRLQPGVPRDLEVICLKCLEKTPERRYESAEALADDLARWAEGRTIRARPVGSLERTLRWARRNPAVAALSVLVLLTAMVGFAGIALKWNEARSNADRAEDEATKAENEAKNAREAAKKERWERYRVSVVAASSELRLEDSNAARRALDDSPEEFRDWAWHLLYARLDKSQFVLQAKETPFTATDITPDGHWALLLGDDRSIRVWDTVNRKEYVPVRDAPFVNCATLSPDGSTLCYEGSEHQIIVCDAQTGLVRATLKAHTKKVNQIGFYRDNAKIISTSLDGTMRVWDVKSCQAIHVFEHGSKSGSSFQLSPDQRTLVCTMFKDSKARLLDLETWREITEFSGHDEGVLLLRFSPSGKRLITVESFPSNLMHLWEVPSGKRLATMRGHSNQINAVRFSPDEKRIATCSMDRTLRIWENAPAAVGVEPQPLVVLKGHTGWVRNCAFSPDGARLVSASQDATLRYWDVKSGDQVAVMRGHAGEVEFVAFTHDGSTIVSSAFDRTVRLWDVKKVERDQAIKGHERFVYSVAFHPDGARIASCSWDGTARVWEATSGRELLKCDHGKNTIVSAVAFHPNGKFLATVARDNGLRLWDAETGKLVHKWEVPTIDWRDTRISFSPGGELLACGSPVGRIYLWDVSTRAEYAVLKNHIGAVRDVSFSPDGRLLASTGEFSDRSVRIWDVARKSQIEVLTGHTACVYAVAWNRLGTLLASGSLDGTVRIWDAKTWRQVGVLKQGANVHGVSFTPDGKLLAVACSDNVIRLWDVESQREIAELSGHSDYVHALAFSPDGSRLASASGDRTIRLWDALSPAEREKK
jgi:WD40 repeat protein/tRNA A-37 threonylcarbamoyl transferase component Bud32